MADPVMAAIEESQFLRQLEAFLAEYVVPSLKKGSAVKIRINGNIFDRLCTGPNYVYNWDLARRAMGVHARRTLLEKFGLRSYPRIEQELYAITFPVGDEGAPLLES